MVTTKHDLAAVLPDCGTTVDVSIGNQTPMTVTCRRVTGHAGQHRGQTLDSDDNPIPYSWSNHAQDGRINRGVMFIVALVGLFLWGFAHGSRTPNGAWIAAVAVVGAVVLLLATGIKSYRRRERRRADEGTRLSKGMKQDTSGAHYLDGAN